ncbi:MAG: UDP-N-acetylmuramoyl-L-alanyl-D-glutamate--2,6-diaminopimelate ligase [Thermoanaerobaculales bacterium]|jgi:UDP-N-acetylmuramoyl-L-alanyl-D-glutamate--2,6-diaminopimelate ligase|nr:UDP-N-acetylmuramoyl-L-alanyl-D-glutamate--2,6-diaminopimelate ligase [Thermoanaerobaculales bacterium]
MKLADLLERCPAVLLEGDGRCEIRGITHDSRKVREGDVFAALPGLNAHGLDFLDAAVGAGASAVLSDADPEPGCELPWMRSAAPRRDMAAMAWALADDPQDDLQLAGITGTNGKSTTAALLGRLLDTGGRPAAVIGTLGAEFGGRPLAATERTTPESTDLATILRSAKDAGAVAAVMEVSSHALMQDRVAGLGFQVGVWTNLTRDHLDYHLDMESYFAAKRRLFDHHLAPGGRRVLSVDDPWGAQLLDEPMEGDVSWGLDRGDVCARDVTSDLSGSTFELRLPDASVRVELPLVGIHNLRNALAAAAAAHASGVAPEAIASGLAASRPLTGRLEPVDTGLESPVFVDYAHTPEGLRAVLQSLRRITDRRLIVVFGAGGDRDRGKRGPMGFAVGQLADVAVVTSDNPRSENPSVIAEAVAAGVKAAGKEPVIELDRRTAIGRAVKIANGRSLVLIAGKGHESTQTVGDSVIPFSDQQVILEECGGAK